MTGSSRRTLPRTVAFWLLAVVLGLFLAAASAPSPLYPVYQDRWQFSPAVLTSVFAVYVVTLLLALVFAGALSDVVGRRPVLVLALVIQLVAMALFAAAEALPLLFAARIVQGLATGLATSAAGAALLDLQPRAGLGALVSGVAPTLGLAAGAVLSGVLVEYGPFPLRLVFVLLLVLFALSLPAVAAAPESVPVRGRWRAGVRPRLGVPPEVRGLFLVLGPSLAAFWSLSGLYLSLGPSVAAQVLGLRSHVAGGGVILCLTGAAAVTSWATRGWGARRMLLTGSAGLVAGVLVTEVAVATASAPLFMAGSVLAGLGFGPAFVGSFRELTTPARPEHRGALVSSVYVVSYLGFSVPAVIAGLLVPHLGLRAVVAGYGACVIVMAGLALAAYLLTSRKAAPPATTAVAPPAAARGR